MTILEAMQQAADRYGQRLDDVMGKRRFPEFVRPRFEGWATAHKLGHSLSAIVRATERDHTTIINGIKRHSQMQEKDA